MAKYIKNTSGEEQTWVSQTIADGAYHLINSSDEALWAANSTLLAAIANAEAIVSSSATSSGEITDTAAAIAYLNNELAREVLTQFEKNNITLKMCCSKGVTTSQSVSLDFKIPGTYGVNAGRKLRSGEAWFASPHADDRIVGVCVIDIDNVVGLGANAVLKVYQDSDVEGYQKGGWYLGSAKAIVEALTGMGSIPAGVYLRVIAEKGGESEDTFYVNVRWGEEE